MPSTVNAPPKTMQFQSLTHAFFGVRQGVNAVVRQAFAQAVAAAFPTVQHRPIVATSKFGDFQCNSAPSLFKTHKATLGLKSPKEVAEKIKENLHTDIFEKVETSPQGFITVNFSSAWIEKRLKEVLSAPIKVEADKRLKVLVDFSSPNVAKEMHVGHLRSTIIGESLSRLLEFVGHEVDRVNHIGDWGTQFGMLIQYIMQEHPDCATNTPAIGDLQVLYRASKERFDRDEEFKAKAREAVVALQSGDPTALQLWKAICDVSRKEFEKVYSRLGVKLREMGESAYNEMLPSVFEELRKKELLKESAGAQCLFTSINNVPLMAVKSDGGYGYDSTDLASIRHRLVECRNDWVIYITDMGQEEHFLKLFEAARMAGWHTPGQTRCSHAGFGVVQGSDGKKFKTRSGEVVRLVDLLDQAVSRAKEELDRRALEEGEEAAASSIGVNERAEVMGYSAVKYFDLKQNRTTDYQFSFDKMLDPRGNTAVYLLYAYARICSIFRKAGMDPKTLEPSCLRIGEPCERQLAFLLLQLPDVLYGILDDLMLHRLAEFTYRVTCLFSDFYMNCKVLDQDEETRSSRLLLCEATRKVMCVAFHILGIIPLERI
ncbi:arginine--tRNA ligase, cytoplasmic [Cyclospora cayetanensis]|uniref:arginine--tRNA ligase n=1 Tax=Cyclospora cayetanensis TaxID=88456 RepID=A0A6P6S0I1_9EIME|nr:arginine--tRNA ligase, cytoplasmic [Cyclospora cayetanensis]